MTPFAKVTNDTLFCSGEIIDLEYLDDDQKVPSLKITMTDGVVVIPSHDFRLKEKDD